MSFYMETMTAKRSMLLTEEEQLEGQTLISIENQEELSDDDVFSLIGEDFQSWITNLRYLDKERQEMLLSYYLLKKPQITLATIFNTTQTVCSFRIRMANKIMGAFMMLGVPDVSTKRVLSKAKLEGELKVPLSQLVAEYAKCRNFATLSVKHNIHRPDIRRAMSRAAETLLQFHTRDNLKTYMPPEHTAVGAYIHSLVNRANPGGQGKSRRERAKFQRTVAFKDPKILGQFRVDLKDPDFKAIFAPKANC